MRVLVAFQKKYKTAFNQAALAKLGELLRCISISIKVALLL